MTTMTATEYQPSNGPALALVPAPATARAPRPRFSKTCERDGCENTIGAGAATKRARQARRFCSDRCYRAGRRAEKNVQTADYLGMASRIVRRAATRVGQDADELLALAKLQAEVTAAMQAAVDGLRARTDAPYSWAEIGEALGITRQGAEQRFSGRVRRGAR